jgi:DNA-binding PadR family transcriptional regulator
MSKNLDFDVLSYLRINGESTSLDIYDYLVLENPHIMFSSLYPSLNRLEKKGFIISRFLDEPSPRRKYYSITRGASLYLSSLSQDCDFDNFVTV